ncbi:MAG: anhydro-N-acetylmuramic acid kinase [Nitrospiria bacterium]
MSGTSADGVDTALVDIRGGARRLQVRLEAFQVYPYPRSLQKELIQIASGVPVPIARICHLNVLIGEYFSEAVLHLADKARIDLCDVDLIGSHGQTIQHLPDPRRRGDKALRATLQIGEPCVIAERTGVTTVADFRPRDMAAGGEGAPLTPYLHYHLFNHRKKSRVVINLGGIGNVTYLKAGAGLDETLAFDTGPANMLIDALVSRLTRSKKGFDEDGNMASRGTVHPELYEEFMRHPFLKKRPPKSTGREMFGPKMVETILGRKRDLRLSNHDLIATVTAFTVGAVELNLQRFILKKGRIDEIIVGGGGVKNPALMKGLAARMAPTPVCAYEKFGLDSRAIEAMTFAVLAYQTCFRRPANIPSVTGARHSAILGKIVPGG